MEIQRSETAISQWPIVLLAGILGCLGVGAAPTAPTLRILGRTPLPPGHSVAKDLRWAGPDSVYVVRALDGVFEVGLTGAPLRRRLTPDVKSFADVQHYDRLAVSDTILAVASRDWSLVWRSRQSEADRTFLLEHKPIALTEDMDLQGDRYLLFGLPKKEPVFGSDGAVVWIGTLSSQLKDLKPVLFDRGGPGVPHFAPCRGHGLGVARFLGDGSFLVVPGFEKGAILYAANGRRVRSWTGEEIGADTDCSGLSREEERDLRMKPETWQRWLNGHHAVDDVLPLPQGPGLLVRSFGADGLVHWQLKVLSGSRIETYQIPIEGQRATDRLRGDVRAGRIALLLSATGWSGSSYESDPRGEIVLAEVPRP